MMPSNASLCLGTASHFRAAKHKRLRAATVTQVVSGAVLFMVPQLFALPNEPFLVRDINATNIEQSSLPEHFVQMGEFVYFIASDDAHGRELWRSGGTQESTDLVFDIQPGQYGSLQFSNTEPDWVVLENMLYFVADDGTHGRELWRTDGTSGGTLLVKDIASGSEGANPFELTVVNQALFFGAWDDVSGTELWTSDGTEAGTVRVSDIWPGPEHALQFYYFPPEFTAIGDTLVFPAWHPEFGEEMWRSDGTEEGTYLLKDIHEGAWSSPFPHDYYPMFVERLDDQIYFLAQSSDERGELWKTNGTVEGTVAVSELWDEHNGSFTFSAPQSMVAVNGFLYFVIQHVDYGRELWISDGSAEGTGILIDIEPGPADSDPFDLVEWNGELVFVTRSGSHSGTLWKSDGTQTGTVPVNESWRNGNLGNYPTSLTVLDSVLFFVAGNNEYGNELWKSDGTEEGTTIVADVYPGADSGINRNVSVVASASEKIYFSANNGESGVEPWTTDGTAMGTISLANIAADVGSAAPRNMGRVGRQLLFSADDGERRSVWRSDTTIEGTTILRDAVMRSSPIDLRGTAFFSALDGVHGEEIWRSDGTVLGTQMITEIREGVAPTGIVRFASLGNSVFFVANDGIHGYEVWRSDGTEAGTSLLQNIAPIGSSNPKALSNINNRLTFFTSYQAAGVQIWQSNGTPEGTVVAGSADVIPRDNLYPFALNNGAWEFLFPGGDGRHGWEVWKSDGTPGGTVLVRDINPGPISGLSSFSPSPPWVVMNGVAYFIADDGLSGLELWKSDGTAQGTVLVKDINIGPGDSNPIAGSHDPHLTIVGDILYFSAIDAEHGRELWRSDGTELGTNMVADLRTGPMSSNPSGIVAAGPCGPFYFSASDGDRGMELWRSDGTEVGTVCISDINPGPASASVENLIVINDYLYFTAVNNAVGRELWALDITDQFVRGDLDCDGVAGVADHTIIASCLRGPAGWITPNCNLADLDTSNSVDLKDYALLQNACEGN